MARKQVKQPEYLSIASASLVNTFLHAADVAEANALESLSTSEQVRDCITTLRSESPDVGAYLSAVVAIFGTTGIHHSKPDYVAGTLRAGLLDKLPGDADEKADALNRIKFRIGQARKVANWLADPVRVKDAEGKTLSEMYKAASTTTAPKAECGAKSTPAEVMTLATMVGKFGVAAVLRECSRILSEDKSTKTQAATVAAIAVQVAA